MRLTGFNEHGRCDPSWIRDERLPARREDATENYRQQERVLLLIEYVGCEHQVERPQIFRDVPPVDQSGAGRPTEIAEYVRPCDVERVLVVIGRKHVEPSGRRSQRAQPHTATKLQRSATRSEE